MGRGRQKSSELVSTKSTNSILVSGEMRSFKRLTTTTVILVGMKVTTTLKDQRPPGGLSLMHFCFIYCNILVFSSVSTYCYILLHIVTYCYILLHIVTSCLMRRLILRLLAALKGMTTMQSEDLGESIWKGAPPVPCLSEVAAVAVQPPPSPSSGVHHSPMVLTSRNKFVSQHDKEQHLKACKEKVSGAFESAVI